MKLANIALVSILLLPFSSVYAYETQRERNKAEAKELEREVDQKMNRMEEKTCMDTDTECLKEKIKHRSKEANESVKDRTEEIKNKIDE